MTELGSDIAASGWQMWAVLAIIVAAIVSYAWEKASMEMTSLAVIGALLLLFQFAPVGVLAPEALLQGFADPALLTILALLVLGQGLFNTGALDLPAQRLMRMGRKFPLLLILVALILVAVVSAFLNNTPVVVIFIPIMVALAEQGRMAAGRVMMPLSFIAVLGGMVTLIGSSTNLLVDGASQRMGMDPIGFFDFAVPGSILAAIGAAYVLFILPRLLPDRNLETDDLTADGKQFIGQIDIDRDHPLVGKTSAAGQFKSLPDITVRMIQRRERGILPPFLDDEAVLPGDALIIAASRKAFMHVLKTQPKMMGSALREVAAIDRDNEEKDDDEQVTSAPPDGERIRTVAEVVVAPASRWIGRNLEQIGLRYQTGCTALGIQRRSRMIRTRMNDIRLEAGDVLLLLGTRASIDGLRTNKDVLLLEWSATELPNRSKANRASLIFAGVVTAAATGFVPIVISALVGAALMIGLGCLNIRQAARSIDRRIFLLIGAALAMGMALQETGGAAYIAHAMIGAISEAPPTVILSAFFLLVAGMTNVLSNNATAVLFTPIAISLAGELGIDPMVFVFTVIFAANCSFATPMAYQTNLLVMGPGHYTFADYVKGGVPLIAIIWVSWSILAPIWYGF